MDFSSSLPDGFTWAGSLGETDIRSLYAACHSLRFSGRLELRDGAQQAEVKFVGGEPVEIDGGDTQRIALWSRGTFRAVQSLPNLDGELTSGREFEGSLAVTKPSALWAWIGQYRLTCDIDLERPGSKAIVSFQNGHAESAPVNGAPELAALARVSSWTDGSFRVRLKPLFAEGVIPHAPPMPDSNPPIDLSHGARQFDVSRSIPMDLKSKPPTPTPTPWPNPGARPAMPEDGRPQARDRSGTQPLERETLTDDDVALLLRPRKPSSLGLWIACLIMLVLAGGTGALYYYHLPPFSPPPKPVEPPKIDEPKVEPPKVEPPKVDTPKVDTQKIDTPKVEEPKVEPKVEEPKVEPKVEEPKAVKPPVPVKDKNADKVDKLVRRARLLLVEGHSHGALDELRKAEKLHPKDAAIKVFEQQAQGKLGHAELILDGKGALTVDGHKFPAPKKLKLAAGPHLIDGGDGESELTLKRGEKKHLKAKK